MTSGPGGRPSFDELLPPFHAGVSQTQAFFKVMNVCSASLERTVIGYFLVQGDVGPDSFYDHFVQGVAHSCNGRTPVGAMRNDLADHRVVKRRHLVTAVKMTVYAYTGPTRRMP